MAALTRKSAKVKHQGRGGAFVSKDDEMKMLFDLQLTDKETYFIGKIVAAWASLEHEVFMQTLHTYVPSDDGGELPKLPKEMNNIQFTGVLRLWKERVVDQAKGKRRKTLEDVHARILRGHEYRKAIVHGMWEWSPDNVERITSTRIVGKQVISVHFDADGLCSFMTALLEINFDLRYPRGATEFFMQRSKDGLYISRRFAAILTGAALDDAPLSQTSRKASQEVQQMDVPCSGNEKDDGADDPKL
ncbi:hypothetical protein WM13_19335 [Burkholderia ubonensis]|nr:hypothetical protein WM10_26935 [Burkholderia ubonensis]KWK14737.1 hypothetical protein WM12_07930 [Burkholderia ubonensis]KWK37366.1 hypothetical protein WM14_25605 [Burkholderia ubonensis]KWK39934.1 hypothetical protein WM13_19335 [Burkholderia ubonensis]